MSPPPDDADLIRKAQAGDEEAFATLVDTWHPRILRWATGLLDDADDADDIAQQVLVRLYGKLSSFRGAARFSTWLYQITMNATRDAMRRRRRRVRALDRMRVLEPPLETADPVAEPLDRADLVRRAREALSTLPDRQRAVLDLVDLQGLAPHEAATLIGIAPATARVHLLRARRALRQALLADLPIGEGVAP